MKQKPPFFILGCVRSGTTLLRNLLRIHPHLDCPEETHFFRWGDPFGTARYEQNYLKNKVIRKQQQIDGITPFDVGVLLKMADTRKACADGYANLYLKKNHSSASRWFDKSPQNIYGILLLSSAYPESKFIHLHRNPLNVVSSLLEGKIMPVHTLKGAINYWVEAMQIMDQYKRAWSDRVLEMAYEALTKEPESHLKRLLEFVGEDPNLPEIPLDQIHGEQNNFRKLLNREQIQEIKVKCEPYFSQYGYA